ncbi:MAG: helix-turn-helix domain-containing protein [Hyphomicrobiaceae bacterium]
MSRNEEVAEGEPVGHGARRANPIDAHVGGRVRLRRMLLNLSQEKLAEQLGLTFQQVQKYEKGINRIGASRLYELAQLLGVGVQYFYEDAPLTNCTNDGPGFAEQTSDNYIVDFLNTREGVELNRAFLKISDPKVRRSILEMVRAIANEDAAQS